jgi:hypothetical protein
MSFATSMSNPQVVQESVARLGIPKYHAGRVIRVPSGVPSSAPHPKSYVPGDKIFRPNSFDVLFGRGKTIREHPGNMVLDQIVMTHFERYESIPKERRSEMLGEIVRLMKSTGTRFIKREDKTGFLWRESDDETAKDKVSHCFRSRRRLLFKHTTKEEQTRCDELLQRIREKEQTIQTLSTTIPEEEDDDDGSIRQRDRGVERGLCDPIFLKAIIEKGRTEALLLQKATREKECGGDSLLQRREPESRHAPLQMKKKEIEVVEKIVHTREQDCCDALLQIAKKAKNK